MVLIEFWKVYLVDWFKIIMDMEFAQQAVDWEKEKAEIDVGCLGKSKVI